jgi:hypothetical protein
MAHAIWRTRAELENVGSKATVVSLSLHPIICLGLSRSCILYIYSTNIRTEYFKHATHSPFFPLQNAVNFIMLPFLVPVLFTF